MIDCERKWMNAEKWSGSVIENEKMCVEMLNNVKSVECKKKMLKDLELWKCKKNNVENVKMLDLENWWKVGNWEELSGT